MASIFASRKSETSTMNDGCTRREKILWRRSEPESSRHRFFVVSLHARKSAPIRAQAAKCDYDRMRIVDLMRQYYFGLSRRRREQVSSRVVIAENMAVRQTKILANIELEDLRRALCLFLPALDSSARSHLAACHVQSTGPVPEIFHLEKSSAYSEFNVVG
jgi:hypothetical protein